jgi:uncharacterized protein
VAVFYFDSSALVKSYVYETGTAWVRVLVDPANANEIYILRLTEVELISATVRRERGGSLPAGAALLLNARMRSDVANEFIPIELSPRVIDTACALAENTPFELMMPCSWEAPLS